MVSWEQACSRAFQRAAISTMAQPSTPTGSAASEDLPAKEWAARPSWLSLYDGLSTLQKYREKRPKFVEGLKAEAGDDVNPIKWLKDNTAVKAFFGLNGERWGNDTIAKLTAVTTALADAGVAHGVTSYGGFNPRYVDGTTTLSNHAFGRAVDLNVSQNPLIKNSEQLDVIKAASGADLLAVTTTDTGATYDAIKKISDDFSAAFTNAWVDNVTDATLSTKISNHRETLDGYAANGILSLNKKLVLAMTNAGFTWGGAYTNRKDLHHFEFV